MDALLTPALGTLVWATIAFLAVLFLLKRFAWGPILGALNDREQRINEALGAAERARQEMEVLHSDNERLLREARAQRDGILKDAREAAEKLFLKRVHAQRKRQTATWLWRKMPLPWSAKPLWPN